MRSVTAIRRSIDPADAPTARPRGRSYRTPRRTGPAVIRYIRPGARRWTRSTSNAERAAHILDGDAIGGGHRHGTGVPGKTEFPASWDDVTGMDNIAAVARIPHGVHQQSNGRSNARGGRDWAYEMEDPAHEGPGGIWPPV